MRAPPHHRRPATQGSGEHSPPDPALQGSRGPWAPRPRAPGGSPEGAQPSGPSGAAPGIHLVHKPVGVSSPELLRSFAAGSPKLCHGGALDPFAEGLLLVLAGEATRMFPYLHDVPKVYEAEVAWGTETDNGDPTGQIVASGGSRPPDDALSAALRQHLGWRDQVPPATSNKRVAGERAWVRAHRGEDVTLPPSRVYLHDAAWTGHPSPTSSLLRVEVRGGYYVRSLVRDLGRTLGCPCHLLRLRRVSIAGWADPGPGQTQRIQGLRLLPWCARLPLPANTRLEVGMSLEGRARLQPAPAPLARSFQEGLQAEGGASPPVLLVADGRVLAAARAEGERITIEAVFGRGL